ncbi:unnamed protein product [Phytophthora fragariaefolia]|uniref:Unnamed protein product n=1 Tax=Phytophthora fragariaefolia TaxID=1490495 RepID=A0A9W6YEL2_9STRA|nr:unnamed protein product [Phytophthora fragariaefolia]
MGRPIPTKTGKIPVESARTVPINAEIDAVSHIDIHRTKRGVSDLRVALIIRRWCAHSLLGSDSTRCRNYDDPAHDSQ